jgi:hypothetical protein
MNLFGNLKGQKWKKTAQYFEKRFFLQILDFHCPSKNFMPHIELMKFCPNHYLVPNGYRT